MSRRSIAEGLQPTGPRQLSPVEQAFKETGAIPDHVDSLKARQPESMTTGQHESVVDRNHGPVSPMRESALTLTPEATKQITVRIPISMWSALIQRITENKAKGALLSSQQNLIQHLIQEWLNQQEKKRSL